MPQPQQSELGRAVWITQGLCPPTKQTQGPNRAPPPTPATVDLREQSRRPGPSSGYHHAPKPPSMLSTQGALGKCPAMAVALVVLTGLGGDWVFPTAQLTLSRGLYLLRTGDTGVQAAKAGHGAGGF